MPASLRHFAINADDVPRATIDDGGQLALAAFKLVGRDIAQGFHAEISGGLLALRTAFGVFAAAQLMLHVRVDDE